ncbi:MAG: hypothetical protein ACYCYP_06865 [Leptospirales bacterium]
MTQHHRRMETIGKQSLLVLLFPLLLVLASCGNGNLFNGVGGNGTGTLQGAETTALQYIANGQYSQAASAMSPYCPNNSCPDTTSANILTDSYIALGTASGSTYQAAASLLVASSSGGYVGTNQIVAKLISLAQNGATASETFNAIAQVVPCIETNSCTSAGISDLLTSLEVQINSGCNLTVGCSGDLASMYALSAALYILTNIQYQTGLTYLNGTWEICPSSGAGTSGCSTSLSGISLTSPLPNNDCWLLFAGLTGASSVCTGTTLPANAPSIAIGVPIVAAQLGTTGANLTNSMNQLLNTILACTSGTCPTTSSSSGPTSVPSGFNPTTALNSYLKSIQSF